MVRVTVERLGHLGDGIAVGPVYVPLTLPGETVDGEIVDGRIATPRIVTPSTDRVRAPCLHFRSCGGCSLQHASGGFVEAWKAQVVRTALQAQGLPAPIRKVVTSPPGTRRRAVLAGRRTKKGALVGFHAKGSDRIVEVPDCRVLKPELISVLPALHDITAMTGSRKGTLSLSLTWSAAGADLAVTSEHDLDGTMRARLAQVPLARLAWNGELVVQRAEPVQRFDSIAVLPPPGAFLQATEDGETALQRSVSEAVEGSGKVLDLFAGCGTFTLPLARNAEVHAVEGYPDMLHALDAGWRKAEGLKRVSTDTRDLFRRPLTGDELRGFDAVVMDPPRAGAEAQAQALAAAGPGRLAMVSCNPVSFARDARILADAGYVLRWIDVVDQFRWSPHVELAALLTRDHMPARC